MKTLHYVLLAGLSHEPRSGYDLSRWLSTVASHFWLVGHSSIYPALARLEEGGLVTHEVVPSHEGPERKVYSLTETGWEALLAWVEEPTAGAQLRRDEQLVKALCYGFLPKETALALLSGVREHHERRLAHYEELERKLKSGLDPEGEENAIIGPARLGTLLTLRRGIGSERSYIEWCDEAAALVAAEHQRTREEQRIL